MTKSYKELLPAITTLMFDIDGVFTDGTVQVLPDGQFIRKLNSKDSYAVQYAVKKGYRVVIISGGSSKAVRESLQGLGISHIFMESKNKAAVYDKFLSDHDIKPEEVLYMGDDIPDFKVMEKSGIAACPADASAEIKRISHYVSHRKGGKGCVRDIIEQTLKVQGKWFDTDAFDW